MADAKLSALDAATSVDYLYGISGGVSKKVGAAALRSLGFPVMEVFEISSAEIYAAGADHELIPAPGAGKAIVVVTQANIVHGGTSYVMDENFRLGVSYQGSVGDDLIAIKDIKSILTQPVGTIGLEAGNIDIDFEDIENKSVVLRAEGDVGDLFSSGSANLTIYYWWTTIDLPS